MEMEMEGGLKPGKAENRFPWGVAGRNVLAIDPTVTALLPHPHPPPSFSIQII